MEIDSRGYYLECGVDDIMGKMVENFLNENFSGSGIDSGYTLNGSTRRNLIINSSYHCMDEHGGYDGWQDFKLLIDKENITEFKLQFTGYRRQKYVYLLRDYLEDCFAYQLQVCAEKLTEGL